MKMPCAFNVGARCGLSVFLLSVSMGCASTQLGTQNPELNAEYKLEGEDESIQKAVEVALAHMQKAREKKGGPTQKGAHTKSHGCVRGKMTVDKNRPTETRFGVFAEEKSFNAWIHYSNAGGEVKSDANNGGRGMAIKLVGVDGEKLLDSEKNEKTQDFLLVNNPVFVVRDIEEYIKVQTSPVWFALGHPRTALLVKALTGHKVSNPLESRYWSMAAHRLGKNAVKYSVAPCQKGITPYPEDPSDNFLAENMEKSLQQREGCFNVMVQFQKDPIKMPVEDPSVEWDETVSPFVKVATLTIPKQAFRSKKQTEFCENLSFTPWHSLAAHQPLGNLNRARKAVYEASAKKRHTDNKAPHREPTGNEVFE